MVRIGAPPASTLDTPLEHLVACHRRIEQRLGTLVKAADYFEKDRAAAFAAIRASFDFLDSNGVLHTEDEEHSLFPRLRPKLAGDSEAHARDLELVAALEAEHDGAEAVLEEVKGLAAQLEAGATSPPAELIERYRAAAQQLKALYDAHIKVEDTVLMPLAGRLLEPAEVAEISSEMRQRRKIQQ